MFPTGIASTGYVLKPPSLRPEVTSRIRSEEEIGMLSESETALSLRGGNQLRKKRQLRIWIISGYHLQPPEGLRADKFNPYVTIELFGNRENLDELRSSKRAWIRRRKSDVEHINNDSGKNNHTEDEEGDHNADEYTNDKVFRTFSAENNGFNPVWNAQCQYEMSASNYGFTFVCFGVNTEDGMFASCTVRVANLNEG